MKRRDTWLSILLLLLIGVVVLPASNLYARQWAGVSEVLIGIEPDRVCTDGLDLGLGEERFQDPSDPPLPPTTDVHVTGTLLPDAPEDESDDQIVLDETFTLRLEPLSPDVPYSGFFVARWSEALRPGSRVRLRVGDSVQVTVQNCRIAAAMAAPLKEHIIRSAESHAPIPEFRGLTQSRVDVPYDVVIDDLNVALLVDHSQVRDLEVILTSPAGTSVTLVSHVQKSGEDLGEIGNCGDYLQSVLFHLDDESTFRLTDADAQPPFTQTAYKPQGSGRLSDFDGQNARGSWTLSITDDNSRSGQGFLECWSMDITAAEPLLDRVYLPMVMQASAPVPYANR